MSESGSSCLQPWYYILLGDTVFLKRQIFVLCYACPANTSIFVWVNNEMKDNVSCDNDTLLNYVYEFKNNSAQKIKIFFESKLNNSNTTVSRTYAYFAHVGKNKKYNFKLFLLRENCFIYR